MIGDYTPIGFVDKVVPINTETIGKMDEKIAELDQNAESVDTDLSAVQNAVDKTQDSADSAQKSAESAQSTADSAVSKNSSQDTDITALQTENAELKEKIAEMEEEISELNSDLADMVKSYNSTATLDDFLADMSVMPSLGMRLFSCSNDLSMALRNASSSVGTRHFGILLRQSSTNFEYIMSSPASSTMYFGRISSSGEIVALRTVSTIEIV